MKNFSWLFIAHSGERWLHYTNSYYITYKFLENILFELGSELPISEVLVKLYLIPWIKWGWLFSSSLFSSETVFDVVNQEQDKHEAKKKTKHQNSLGKNYFDPKTLGHT